MPIVPLSDNNFTQQLTDYQQPHTDTCFEGNDNSHHDHHNHQRQQHRRSGLLHSFYSSGHSMASNQEDPSRVRSSRSGLSRFVIGSTLRSVYSIGSSRPSTGDVPPLSQILPTGPPPSERVDHAVFAGLDSNLDYPVIPIRSCLKPTVLVRQDSYASFQFDASFGSEKKGFRAEVEEVELEREARQGWRFYVGFGSICLMNFMSHVSVVALCTALQSIAQDLSLTSVQSFGIPGSFFLSSAVMQPLYMRLSVALDCQRLLLFGLVLCVAGNTASLLASAFTCLILGRILDGIGTGAITILTNLTLGQMSFWNGFSLDTVKKYERLSSLASLLGIALGPLVCGSITDSHGWRSIFVLQGCFSLAAFGLTCFISVPSIRAGSLLERACKVDYIGWVLLACALVLSITPILVGGVALSWTSWQIILPLVLGLVGLAAWWSYSKTRMDPIIPVSIFRNRSSLVSCFGLLVHGMLVTSIAYFLPLLFLLDNANPKTLAEILTPWTVAIFLAGALSIYSLSFTGYRWPIWTGWILGTSGFSLMLLLRSSSTTMLWIPVGILSGAALGILAPSLNAAVAAAASNDDETIHSTSVGAFVGTLGQAIGLVMASCIFLSHVVQNDGNAGGFANIFTHASSVHSTALDQTVLLASYTSSLQHVWIAGCIVAAIALVLSVGFTERRRPSSTTLP